MIVFLSINLIKRKPKGKKFKKMSKRRILLFGVLKIYGNTIQEILGLSAYGNYKKFES